VRCGWCWSIGVTMRANGRRSPSIAQKCGMTAETLRKWVRQTEIDGGRRPGISSAEAQRIKELEFATLQWVDWYNHQRLHGSCDRLTPVEYEQTRARQTTQ
jgi:transposase InsO family protein